LKVAKADVFERVKRSVKKAELERLVRDLVGMPSHSEAPAREKEVATFIRELLEDEGVEARLRNVERDRPNVLARIDGHDDGKSLMLNGHTDTVAPYDMDIPPFKATVKGGRLYGRGSLDMKGGLGAMVMTLVAMRRARVRLRGTLLLAGVVGEELRSEGTEDLVLKGPAADMAIVGEPTGLQIQPYHRGLEWLEIHFYGKAAHGGEAHHGVNAIPMAARFVRKVEDDLAPRLRARKSRHGLPPTINLGVIQGGQQPSSVADHCVVRLDRRWVPEEPLRQVFQEIQDILDDLRKEDPEFKAELRRDPANMKTMTHVPNVVRRNHKLVQSLQESVGLVTGRAAVVSPFFGWTDAALLTHFAKTPAVVFGPGGEGAHARTEYVLTDDLVRCMHVYSKTALDVCGQASRS